MAAGNEEFSASLDDNNYYVFEFESLREAHESHEVNLDPIEFYQAIENFQEEAKGSFVGTRQFVNRGP